MFIKTSKLLIVLGVIFVTGCSTIKDSRSSINEKKKHQYSVSIETLWIDTIKIINNSDLQLVYEDKPNGNILAQTPINAFSWGENVFINLYGNQNESFIRISCKRAIATNITSTDWESFIIKKLDNKLNQSKLGN
ncbi:TPA: hypothetical protein ACF311_000129 [Vibrio parahaemolyticus]|uniref:hypothetical protein n=1 Tax=Vibrio parahaemolyticus TaxID=670 RepID=UPI0004D95690|nr:hypothetical protein [Vibrio parahaemolyticus]OQU52198.1 hypothetical protein EM74_004090 [Vibrio parahaemolyticus]HCH4058373.1 hypothetical protein [Vibrio parahaemolyticus]